MEKQKLPNATVSLILGILSFIACCFSSGLGGVILSGIALYLANKDIKTFQENPENYDNYSQVKTARTIAIIGLILGGLILLISIIFFIAVGAEGYNQYMEEIQKQYGGGSY